MVNNREERGRKQKFSPRVVRKVVREVNLNPGITSRTILNNLSASGIEIYQSTLQRTFRKERLPGFGPRKAPLHQIKTSPSFANENLEKDVSFLLFLVRRDEAGTFWLQGRCLRLAETGEAFKPNKQCCNCKARVVELDVLGLFFGQWNRKLSEDYWPMHQNST